MKPTTSTIRKFYSKMALLSCIFLLGSPALALFDEPSSSTSLFDRHDQIPLCLLRFGDPEEVVYQGPACDNDMNEWGCTCANSQFDCQNRFEATVCEDNDGVRGTCVLRTNGEPMCARPVGGDTCATCNVKDDCFGFQQCVYIGEPYRNQCATTPSMACGTQVCMDFHNL